MELNDFELERIGSRPTEMLDHRMERRDDEHDCIESMAPAMRRKEQEFIDHTLLAPTYIRDSNNFIIDDLIEPPVSFSKSVVNVSTAAAPTDTSDGGDGYAVKESLSSELNFHNSIFHFVNKQGDWQPVGVVGGVLVSSSGATLNTTTVSEAQQQPPLSMQTLGVGAGGDVTFNMKHVSEEFMALNDGDDFVDAAGAKRFCVDDGAAPNGSHSGTGSAAGGVQQFPSLSLLGETNVVLDDVINDDSDNDERSSHARKVLPHKKRISRKLKVAHEDGMEAFEPTQQVLPALPLEQPKLPEDRFNGRAPLQFNCELCGYSSASQLDFFAHLKQHYEPSAAPNPLLPAAGTVNATLGEQVLPKSCENICALEKKAEEQVYPDVHLNFQDFSNVDVRAVMNRHQQHQPLHHHQPEEDNNDDIKILSSVGMDNYMGHPELTAATAVAAAARELPLKDITVDEVEFSDTEDMLEGIRNVVDKVSIEDTCDDIDLMTTHGMGFSNDTNAFKLKTFADLSFTGALAQLPVDGGGGGADGESVSNLTEAPKNVEASLNNEEEVNLLSYASCCPEKVEMAEHNEDAVPFYAQPKADTDTTSVDTTDAMTTVQLGAGTYEKCSRLKTLRPREKLAKIWGDIGIGNVIKEDAHEEKPLEKISDDSSEYRTESDNSEAERDEEDDDDFNDGECYDVESGEAVTSVAGANPIDASSAGDKMKKHICGICKRAFNSSNALKYHNRTHTGVRPHPCEICGRSFFARSALNSHVRTHTGDKPFECEQCERKFRQWGDLKFHVISIHTAEKSHQCEFCGKAFARKYSLVLHRRIHTSERNYKCEYCAKTFRASSYLQNHRKIHTGEKPHECEVCGKKFRVSGDLRRHMRIHQPKLGMGKASTTVPAAKRDATKATEK